MLGFIANAARAIADTVKKAAQALARLARTAAQAVADAVSEIWQAHLEAMATRAEYRAAVSGGAASILAAASIGPLAATLIGLVVGLHVAAFTPDKEPAPTWPMGRGDTLGEAYERW